MVCPKCGDPWAMIWMGCKLKDHECGKCGTCYHEDNELERLSLCIIDCKKKIKNNKSEGHRHEATHFLSEKGEGKEK